KKISWAKRLPQALQVRFKCRLSSYDPASLRSRPVAGPAKLFRVVEDGGQNPLARQEARCVQPRKTMADDLEIGFHAHRRKPKKIPALLLASRPSLGRRPVGC